jgi:hypothetical protein
MRRAFNVTMVMAVLMSACTQKVVCPAYQSAFIHDKDELRKKFSYFHEDASPKIYAAKKTKYLIAQPTTFRQKTRSLQTVEMKAIQPVVPDSLLFTDEVSEADLDRAARSVIDSIYIVDVEPKDSVAAADAEYVISIDREVRVLKYNFPDSLKYDPETGAYVAEKPYYYVRHVGFNLDQDSYLWYLRDVLVLPDVRLAKEQAEARKAEVSAKEKKGLKGFFSGLFGKKKKGELPEDVTEEKSSFDKEEYNYDEFEDRPEPTTATSQPVKQKKGIFSMFSKKDKPKKQKAKPSREQPEKEAEEEEDDDGF